MRISELAARTGVPLATVKYYLREGLLMPGRATSATQAQYDDTHMRRLGLVRALAGQGLPLDKIKAVVALAENPDENLFVALGKAVMALPPYVDNPPDATTRALARCSSGSVSCTTRSSPPSPNSNARSRRSNRPV